MKIEYKSFDIETELISTFWFKPDRPFTYTAGQYVELTLRHEAPDSRGEKHFFTLSSAPGHELASVTSKYAGDEKSSTFKKALFHLELGAELEMSKPEGDFVLPSDPNVPLVFVAGGIGLTPFHSMFEWMADHDEKRNIQFLYSVRSEEEIIFQDTFDRAGTHATIIVENPSDAWGGERGRLTPEQIISLTNPTPETLIYISGPEPMVEAFENGLVETGLPKRLIITDFFPGYTDI